MRDLQAKYIPKEKEVITFKDERGVRYRQAMDAVLASVREEYSKEQVEQYRREEREAIEKEFNP